jgi:hypothetical protein
MTVWNHPEKRECEVFLSNMNQSQFDGFHWSSKRPGVVAYDGTGAELYFEDWFPVFVKKNELTSKCIELPEVRRVLRGNDLT